jgi:sulfite exporter TauE/SafE
MIDRILTALFSTVVANIILIIIGLGFIVTHNLWIKNIYNRFMKRRYKNMEEFRASR